MELKLRVNVNMNQKPPPGAEGMFTANHFAMGKLPCTAKQVFPHEDCVTQEAQKY